ncbi:MAG TPA: ribosome recycling factor [Clostridiales bacterium]|nr:MAG: Ribosome-recycling factor [Firmicutes bacterium ADurb.Bin262]HOU10723.1 ribosome recycling factor [Clostridiales bacterium]HQH62675.1 ribosome recycling factor [Clostridiales bacterium]HQK73527.1 ribosome recycling factor [Clostridiales bacterium]
MDEMITAAKEKMNKTLSVLKNEYSTIRAGRASPAVLERIRVDYYGVPTPINQMAQVSVSEARILNIQPYDVSTLHPIEKAIQASDLGINPQNDGRVIRLVFPPLTEDKRRDIVRDIKKMAEEAKVAVRSIRRDTIEKLKKMEKASEITEDDLKDMEKDLQKVTDDHIKDIDSIAEIKEKEVMEI